MCRIEGNIVQRCAVGRKTFLRREAIPLFLRDLSIDEIAQAIPRASKASLRNLRFRMENEGCLPRRVRTCPECPPESPTPTPMGGRCHTCEMRRHSDLRRNKKEAARAAAEQDVLLPEHPRPVRRWVIGTLWIWGPVHTPAREPDGYTFKHVPFGVQTFSRSQLHDSAWNRVLDPTSEG